MMTEREAWTAIADTLEMLDGKLIMRSWEIENGFEKEEYCYGLCAIVDAMYDDEVVTADTANEMDIRIDKELEKARRTSVYLYPKGLMKPRIELARRFARESK